MKKLGPRLSAICVAGAGVLLCGLALLWPEPVERRPFTLAVGVWPGMETLTLARERGALPETKLNFVELSWTSATMMAFENRVVDGAVVTLDEMLRLKSGGHAIKAVLVLGKSAGGDVIVARPEIRSLAELKGKRVGVELRACGEYLLTLALRNAGLSLEDVILVPLNLAESENAYEQHELDALVTVDPSRVRLMAKGAHVLFDSMTIQTSLYRVLVVRKDFLEARRDILCSLVKIHFETLKSLRSGTGGKEMDAVLRREQLTSSQFAETLERITDFSPEANRKLLNAGPNGLEPILETMAEFMKKEGLLEETVSSEGLLDSSLVKGD